MFKKRRRHSFSGVLKLGAAGLALWGVYWFYQNAIVFDPDKILEKSIESLAILGGVPVFNLSILKPYLCKLSER